MTKVEIGYTNDTNGFLYRKLCMGFLCRFIMSTGTARGPHGGPHGTCAGPAQAPYKIRAGPARDLYGSAHSCTGAVVSQVESDNDRDERT